MHGSVEVEIKISANYLKERSADHLSHVHHTGTGKKSSAPNVAGNSIFVVRENLCGANI